MKIDDKPVRTNLSVILLLLVVFFGSSTKASAANVKLKWDASPSLNVTNYVVYYGTERGTYSFTNNVSTNLTTTVSNLTVGVRYYFVVTAKDAIGVSGRLGPLIDLIYAVAKQSAVLDVILVRINRRQPISSGQFDN